MLLNLGFYDAGAAFLWGAVVGVLSSFLLATLTKNANVKAVSTVAAFIAGAVGSKYVFEHRTNATLFWYLLGLTLIWLCYWALNAPDPSEEAGVRPRVARDPPDDPQRHSE
jgi:hypothetical protein